VMEGENEEKRKRISKDVSVGGGGGGGGGYSKKLYGEAPPRGPTPYPFIYHCFRKGTLSYTFYWKKAPLSYIFLGRLRNKSLKQEDFLSFFSRSA